jgi:anti-anti-sigma regulatory factor
VPVMPEPGRQERASRTVGVDRLRGGDHAFLSFRDDAERWEILSLFAQQGLMRDEKIILLVDAGHRAGQVAARVAGGPDAARRATATGQLIVSNAPRFARGKFDAARLVEGVRRRIDTSIADGFSGLRGASEMSLALAPVDHLDQAVRYETALHEAFFSGEPDPRYTALCYWDERLFGGTDAMAAAHAVHPVTVLPRVGALHVAPTAEGVTITGDSDLTTRGEFDAALRELSRRPRSVLVLDLTDLSFLDAHGAGSVLRLAAGLAGPRRLEVRCRDHHRRMFRLLGSAGLERMAIVTGPR